ncbi:MAG: hypothetical protein CTY31_00275 [Hyphomicrobium sp.]|nr:MAG: hypothetical protein CTY39_09550 [Hyphomicrobium sp.]PPD01272.1 MAG: hypothetical protein CTY31_00275 [Hyphomicrobium sp.]
MSTFKSCAVLLVIAAFAAGPATAQDKPAADTKPDVSLSDNRPDAQLTPEEKAERDGRKACKVEICSAFRSKQATGRDISCDIVKSWRKEQLNKLVGKLKVTWPYEGVRCSSKVNLKRADLMKAMSDPKLELQLDPHSVSCVVNRDKEPATEIKLDFSPKVMFENGKAKSAEINWGKIEAPTLIKSALWTATAADNTANILSGTLVEDINDFIGKKCDEVKDQWATKQ